MKQIAVIGLGRFGMGVVQTLTKNGCEVLAIDEDERKVHRASEFSMHAVQANATDEAVLKGLGLRNFDCVVVAIGQDIQVSVVVTLMLKEMGVKCVITKAQSDIHGQILSKVGADRVIFPEREMGARLARSLMATNILEYVELSPEHSMVETVLPDRFSGKTLREMNIRARFAVNVIAIRRGREIIVPPQPDEHVENGDILITMGKNSDLDRLSRWLN